MNKQKWVISILALGLMGGAAGVLAQLQMHQKLGAPGVTTSPQAGTDRLRVDLPAHVPDYESEWVEPDEIVLGSLPQDTSFGQRHYKAADGFEVALNVVLMGTDRTSLHKPQTGVLQRWAYVSYFAPCAPGQEDATFERMKKLITSTVPDFQLTPRATDAPLTARQ